MKISEAVEKALEQKKMIYRRNIKHETGYRSTFIKPTNSYNACIVISYCEGKETASCRRWNPTGDDLMADDWELWDEVTDRRIYEDQDIQLGKVTVNCVRQEYGLSPIEGLDKRFTTT